MPSREELGHWWFVARGFSPCSRRFWLGLLHDTVEDGYLPRWFLAWPALNAITRRDGEQYAAYIERVAGNPHARAVKLRDLHHNLTRNGGPPRNSLRWRYLWAREALKGDLPAFCSGAMDPEDRCPRHPSDCVCWKYPASVRRQIPEYPTFPQPVDGGA